MNQWKNVLRCKVALLQGLKLMNRLPKTPETMIPITHGEEDTSYAITLSPVTQERTGTDVRKNPDYLLVLVNALYFFTAQLLYNR